MIYNFYTKFSSLVFSIAILFASFNANSQSDNCGGAVAINANTSCVTSIYAIKKAWGVQTGGNAPSSCASGWDHDGWFSVTVPAGVNTITITATTDKNLALGLFSGSCGSLAQVTCTNAGGNGVTETLVASVSSGTTYLINLAHNGNNASTGNICVVYSSTPPANDQCPGATVVTCGNNYTGSTGLATSTGDPAGTCGTSAGTPGVWFKFTGNGNTVTASLCGSSYDTKIQVYTGACGGAQVCVNGNDDYCSLQSQVTWASTNAVDYYIFVGGFFGATGTYSLTMSCVVPSPPNCSVYTSPTNGTVLTCATTNLNWNVPVGGGTPTQYLLYFGTDAAATNINNGTNIGNVLSYSPPGLLANTTYYWKIVPQNGAGSASGCSTYSFTTGGTSIINDLCGGAISLTSGVTINDDNTCAGDEAPLAAGTCWSGGAVNSLWYSINVTAGTLGVLTSSISLVNTQIAVYSGACASLTQIACNDDAPGAGCSAATTANSQLNLTGLANGTYYIRVDGRNNNVGTYNVMATTTGNVGTANPIPGQDCLSPQVLCANPLSVGDPGYANTGNICDWSGYGNCTSGEKNALWVQFSIQTAGSLLFNIIPTDYTGCDTETDYDWVLYKMSGSGSTTCANISSTSGDGEVACNFSYLGVTGMAAGGNQPGSGIAPAPSALCYDAAYEAPIVTTVGEIYYLVIQNYSSSTQGFTLNFPGGGAVPNLTTPSQVLWTGGANTSNPATAANWGGCAIPSCGGTPVDGVVAPSSASQPVISANTAVKSLTINPGATLTINANIKLDVCGDFINNGSIICAPGSTVNFNGTGTQLVSGNLTGTNEFSNFMVTKTSGSVSLLSNIEAGQNIITSNITSIINTNGVDIYLGGDFLNSHGGTTFMGIGLTSTFFFNGAGAQVYNPNKNAVTPILVLNNVTMNNSSTGVTISATNTPDMYLGTNGVLSLIAGKIITPGTQEVEVQNTTSTAVTAGNTTSFVQGNLRRYLAAGATGSFDFPVGHATPGYERASINFISAAAAGAIQLVARFDPWGAPFPQPAVTNWGPECSVTYNSAWLNHGYWSIDASAASTGNYNLTLYNRSYSNAASGWSIAKSPSGGPAWALNGTCQVSPVTGVIRNGMSGFSKFATIQSSVPLPVELLEFNGVSKGTYNDVYWKSAVETNFYKYELESSEDAIIFSKITEKMPLGATNSINNYSYKDYGFYSPITYYRLKMIDLDATFKYSSIISVENSENNSGVVTIYPNPAINEINIMIKSSNQDKASVSIKDVLGREVFFQNIDLSQNLNVTTINTSNYADGTYIVTVNYGNQPSSNQKVIINKKN
jgi:hypothetical protein